MARAPSSLRMTAVAAVLVAILFGTTGIGATAATTTTTVAVETTPALPLLDVIFLATTSAGTDRTLFVSIASDCSTALTPICTLGRSQVDLNYNATTCIFNITGASLSVDPSTAAAAIPSLYWCSSAAGSASFAALQMNKVASTPSYAYLNTQTALTMNAATPIGSTVGFYTTSACTTLLSGTSTTTLTSSRTLTVNVGGRGITYLCASVPTVEGGTSALVARTIIYGTNSYDIYTTEGVRHRSVTISADATFLYLSLSIDPQCVTLAQAYQQTTSGTAVLTIDVPRGTYYFCAIMSAGVNSIGVFVPALSTFTVHEYGVQPQTMYTNHATTMSFALDALALESTLQAALFTTSACDTTSGGQLTTWSSTMTWTVNTAGTYYACVRTGTSTTQLGFVNEVVVSAIPTVALSRTPGIMGLGEVATVTRSSTDTVAPAVLTIGISSSSSCSSLLQSGDTTETGTTASFYIPENSPSTVFLCVSNRLTTDKSNGQSSEATTAVYYSLSSLTLSTYSLSYPALRTKTAVAIQLDNSVDFSSNAYMYLAPALSSVAKSFISSSDSDDASCDAAIAASPNTMSFSLATADFTLTPVSFPTAGSWWLCVKEVNVLQNAAVLLRTLTVYGNAMVTPSGVLPGIPASLSVTAVPASTTVALTTATACSASMTVVATTTSTLTGTATLSVTSAAPGTLILCVGYRGESNSQDTAAVLMPAGQVQSTSVRVVPSVAVAATRTTLAFSAPGASTLNGFTALLIEVSAPSTKTTACPTSASSGMTQLPISATATQSALATATFTPDTSLAGTTYLVCAGTAGAYLPSGTLYVVAAPALTTIPASLANGLPAQLTLPSSYMSAMSADSFAVISGDDSCTQDLSTGTLYASGTIEVATGATAVFLAPARSTAATTMRLCAAQQSNLVSSTLGYSDAGTVSLTQFTSVSRYAQRQRTNTIVVSPVITGGTSFLVACSGTACRADSADATCASTSATRYTTSSTVTLTAPVGTYLLCQSVSSPSAAVVGSSTTVQVVDPYVLTTSADTSALRAYVPFTVSLSGGPAETSGTYNVVVQPASVDCGTTPAESQSFSVTGGSASITITALAPELDIQFCVRPSGTDGFQVLTAHLVHYMTPAAVIAGEASTLTSGSPASGVYAKLSRASDCSAVVAGGAAQALVDGTATFKVLGCDATTKDLQEVYYCEGTSSGAYTSRGALGLLRRSSCTDGGQPASIGAVHAKPGTALTDYGVATAYLTNPRLSRSGACTSLVDSRVGTLGYAPAYLEDAVFYVCAQLVGSATVTFTTTTATLSVANWAATPSAALSRYNLTMGTQPSTSVALNFVAPTANTFFSTSASCGASLASASGLAAAGGTAAYRTVGVNGLVYVCTTDPLTADAIAVAALLSVTPPAVTQAVPAIVRGATYTATLVVPGASPLYSMLQGADDDYEFRGYYTSSNRSVFLSLDECGSRIAGVATTTADSSGRVSFATDAGFPAGASSVALCAGTAAGVSEVMSRVAVAPGHVYPTQYVTGVWRAAIYLPTHTSTSFTLSNSNGDCSATAGMPTFTTDSQGYGALSLVTPQNSAALAVGTYTLCANGGASTFTAVDTIEVIEAAFFGLRGTTFVVGVPSTMELLQDLVSSYLYTGFSETRDCAVMTSDYGSWASLSDTSIQVSATTAYTSGLYLCAQSPQNSSIIALPASTASTSALVFASSSIGLPSGGWDACSTYALDQCYPPGSGSAPPPSSTVLAMVHGDCCASTRAVVGESGMGGGTCRLALDYAAVSSHGAGATFNLCVLSRDDAAVCTTVASGVSVSTSCTPASRSRRLGGGAIAGIVVGSVVGGLLLAALVAYLVWLCCCRQSAGKDGKAGELIAFQEFAEDDQHLVGYVFGGRHPLLYYPSGSGVGRSISPSPPYPSTGSGGYSAVEEMEEGERDQIALQEARARYNLRLHFSEALLQMEAEAKNTAVDAGLDATWASGDSYLRGVAQPVRRCVESIITDDGEAEELSRGGAPSASAGPAIRRAAADASTLAAQEVPQERDVNLTADGNASVEVDPATGRFRKVRSRSIESAARPELSPAESYLTNDDFEEREEDEQHDSTELDIAYNGSAFADEMQQSPDARSSRRAGGYDSEDDLPRHRLVVRHFTNPSSVKARRRRGGSSSSQPRSRSSQRREGSRGGRPHADPTHLDAEAPQTPVQEAASVFDAAAHGAKEHVEDTPDRCTRTASGPDDSANESAVLARSPITSPDAHDLSEGALTMGGIDGVPSPAKDAHKSHRRHHTAAKVGKDDGDVDDDDEEDLLSFTITQRFHDEKRFLLDQEDGRRQRLYNWEEEERAQMAQEELNAYMALPPLGAEAHEGVVFATTSSYETTADGQQMNYTAQNTTTGIETSADVSGQAVERDEEEEEEEEQVFHAPYAPARLPSLPPAPRPQTLQNEHYYVVSAEQQ